VSRRCVSSTVLDVVPAAVLNGLPKIPEINKLFAAMGGASAANDWDPAAGDVRVFL